MTKSDIEKIFEQLLSIKNAYYKAGKESLSLDKKSLSALCKQSEADKQSKLMEKLIFDIANAEIETLRDKFAMYALNSLLEHELKRDDLIIQARRSMLASNAYLIADAMLKAREVESESNG